MSIHGDVFTIRPLVGDAMSEFFKPQCDEEGQEHTIGRLTFAAVDKGAYKMTGLRHVESEYAPPWAPHMIVKVQSELQQNTLKPGIALFSSLTITDQSRANRTLKIVDDSYPREGINLCLALPGEIGCQRQELALGDKLKVVRNRIARAALIMFETVDS